MNGDAEEPKRYLCKLTGHKVELGPDWKNAEDNRAGDVFTIAPGLFVFATEDNSDGPGGGFKSVRSMEVVVCWTPGGDVASIILKDGNEEPLYIITSEPREKSI